MPTHALQAWAASGPAGPRPGAFPRVVRSRHGRMPDGPDGSGLHSGCCVRCRCLRSAGCGLHRPCVRRNGDGQPFQLGLPDHKPSVGKVRMTQPGLAQPMGLALTHPSQAAGHGPGPARPGPLTKRSSKQPTPWSRRPASPIPPSQPLRCAQMARASPAGLRAAGRKTRAGLPGCRAPVEFGLEAVDKASASRQPAGRAAGPVQ